MPTTETTPMTHALLATLWASGQLTLQQYVQERATLEATPRVVTFSNGTGHGHGETIVITYEQGAYVARSASGGLARLDHVAQIVRAWPAAHFDDETIAALLALKVTTEAVP